MKRLQPFKSWLNISTYLTGYWTDLDQRVIKYLLKMFYESSFCHHRTPMCWTTSEISQHTCQSALLYTLLYPLVITTPPRRDRMTFVGVGVVLRTHWLANSSGHHKFPTSKFQLLKWFSVKCRIL